MRTRPFLSFVLFAVILISSGCGPAPLPGVVTAPAPTVGTAAGVTQLATPAPLVTPTVVEPQSLPLPASPQPGITPTVSAQQTPQYVINAIMDYDAKTLKIQQEITFTNTYGTDLTDMLLAVEPNRRPDVFNLVSLSIDDVAVKDYSLADQHLRWTLTSPIKPGLTAHIQLEYNLALPEIEQGDPNVIRPQIFGVMTKQVNLTDWYPMLVPYEPGTGWKLAEPWFYGEHMIYPLANFDVSLRFVDPANAPVVAASAMAEPIDGGARYTLERGRDFALAMGRQMQVVSGEAEGVSISSYYFPGNKTGALAVLDATEKSIKTYSALFGPYPHKSLAAVQGDFNDGMEFDGLYYLSNGFYNLYDGTPNNFLVMIAAHETSHQWWFGRVANDQAKQPWLDESLATYCEKLFYENNYPDSLKWWRSYRIDFYQPEGMIDGDVPSYGGFTPYTNATYRRGTLFLDGIREIIGDEAFFAFLKDYATQMDGLIATPSDFFRILRLHSNANLGELVAKYFANPPK
jgi:hypothetical protein